MALRPSWSFLEAVTSQSQLAAIEPPAGPTVRPSGCVSP